MILYNISITDLVANVAFEIIAAVILSGSGFVYALFRSKARSRTIVADKLIEIIEVMGYFAENKLPNSKAGQGEEGQRQKYLHRYLLVEFEKQIENSKKDLSVTQCHEIKKFILANNNLSVFIESAERQSGNFWKTYNHVIEAASNVLRKLRRRGNGRKIIIHHTRNIMETSEIDATKNVEVKIQTKKLSP